MLKDPARFGLYLTEPPSRDPESRKRILTDVIRRGWIRVRMHRNQYTFETWRITDDVLFTILEFADRHKFWDTESLDIHELGRVGGGAHLKVGQLKKKLAPTIEALENRRRECAVVRLCFDPVTDAVVRSVSESLDRLNWCGMTYLYEDSGKLVLESHAWSTEDGYQERPEAILVLIQAESKLIESKLMKLPDGCARIGEVEVLRG